MQIPEDQNLYRIDYFYKTIIAKTGKEYSPNKEHNSVYWAAPSVTKTLDEFVKSAHQRNVEPDLFNKDKSLKKSDLIEDMNSLEVEEVTNLT